MTPDDRFFQNEALLTNDIQIWQDCETSTIYMFCFIGNYSPINVKSPQSQWYCTVSAPPPHRINCIILARSHLTFAIEQINNATLGSPQYQFSPSPFIWLSTDKDVITFFYQVIMSCPISSINDIYWSSLFRLSMFICIPTTYSDSIWVDTKLQKLS